jgi:hypothetical protein
MSALLEPPPLLTILVLVGVAALAVWWGTRGAVLGRRVTASATATESEDAERWSADDPPLPQKQRYVYRPPAPVPAPLPPQVAPAAGADAMPIAPASAARDTAGDEVVPAAAGPAADAAERDVVSAAVGPADEAAPGLDAETPNQTENLEVSLAGFFGGGSRARTGAVPAGETTETAPTRTFGNRARPEATGAPNDPKQSADDSLRSPEPDRSRRTTRHGGAPAEN